MSNAEGLEQFSQRRITYRSDDMELDGYLWEPKGSGPFAGIVFNHGSAGLAETYEPGIQALVDLGYAVLAPIRRGYNGNPGTLWSTHITGMTEEDETLFGAFNRQFVEALVDESRDVLAAAEWLRHRSGVDPQRIANVGQSFGGIMVMLVAGQDSPFRCGVSFAGPSITWPNAPGLQRLLLERLKSAQIPLFLIQSASNYSLEPIYVLGHELARQGRTHEIRIYQRTGDTPMEGHGFFLRRPDLWRDDVQRFLDQWMS